jgi:hypothetical protein
MRVAITAKRPEPYFKIKYDFSVPAYLLAPNMSVAASDLVPFELAQKGNSVMATLVTKLSFVTRVAISGVWLTSHNGFFI